MGLGERTLYRDNYPNKLSTKIIEITEHTPHFPLLTTPILIPRGDSWEQAPEGDGFLDMAWFFARERYGGVRALEEGGLSLYGVGINE